MASSVPSALTALTAVVTAAVPSATVIHGEVGTYVAAVQVVIGDVNGSDTPATLVGGAPQSYAESYDITTTARAWSGGDDLKAIRTQGLAMKDAIRDALAADQSMGGVVNQAYLARYTVRTAFDEHGKGVACEVGLTIHVDNYQH